MKIKAPCYTGIDCPDRKVGCRKYCEAWQEYEARVAADRKRREKEYKESCDYSEFIKRQKERRRK